MATINELFDRARSDHQHGQVARAVEGYRQVLQAEPARPLAWYLLGVACHSLGRPGDAIAALGEAVRLNPGHPEARNHLGIVLGQCGRVDEAMACFRQALAIRPDFLDAHTNLALALQHRGDLGEAIASYRRAIELKPDFAEGYRQVGILLRRQGRHDEARAALEQALRLNPNVPETLNDLGLLLELTGRFPEAVERYHAAIRLRPDFPGAFSNLSVALDRLGKLDEAVAAAREAVRLKPDFAGAHNNLGVLLERQEAWEQAEAAFREALRLEPQFVQALYNMGSVVGKLGRLDETETLCRQALLLKPDSPEAYHNLAYALAERGRHDEAEAAYRRAIALKPDFVDPYINLTSVLNKLGRLDEAEDHCRHAVQLDPGRAEAHSNLGFVMVDQGRLDEAFGCYREAMRLKPASLTIRGSFVFSLNFDPDADPASLLAEHRRWGTLCEEAATVAPLSGRDRDRDRPLRVGYISPDLRTHPVAYFLEPILASHDRSRVESTCYAQVSAQDAVTARLRSLAHAWRWVYGLGDDPLAEQIRRDGIDILVDLAGHTAHHRLAVLARKPAPVQVTYLGYPNTTGLSRIDYLLTDDVVDPVGEPPWSSEEPWRIPGGFCCYAPASDAPEVSPLPALRTGSVTFASLHKLPKLNPQVLDLWAELLRAIPSARLLLFRNNLRGRRKDEILGEFAARGISPDRLDARSAVDGGHLAVYRDIDVSLDAFPWCGHTTACESIWMGAPIITLSGNRHASRMTASVLTTLGMTELIARTPEEYIGKAVELAGDLDRLAAMRASLRTRMRESPLCDGPGWTRRLEDAYRAMWHRWCDAADQSLPE